MSKDSRIADTELEIMKVVWKDRRLDERCGSVHRNTVDTRRSCRIMPYSYSSVYRIEQSKKYLYNALRCRRILKMTKVEHRNSQSKLRKKLPIQKKVLLVVLSLILALAATAAFAYSRYLHPTGEIMSAIYAVKNDRAGIPMVNFFLLQVGEKYIAIDTGSDRTQTENELQKLGISADDVIAVFITHSHYDHVGSLHLFDEATMYTGDTEFQYATVSRFSPLVFELPDIPHIIMVDGESVELYGRTIQCIYSPGHTSDSVSFLVDGRYLFVGDLFVTLNNAQDGELQVLSRENVLDIDDVEYIFTGHFGLFKDVRFFQ